MRYAERTQVYRQASLIRRMIVLLRGALLKRSTNESELGIFT